MIAKIFEQKINNLLKKLMKETYKEKTSFKWNHYLDASKDSYKKDDV